MGDESEQKFIQVVKEISLLVKNNEAAQLQRDQQIQQELSQLRKISEQMVQVLNDQGWIKKILDKHENWLIQLSKRVNNVNKMDSCSKPDERTNFHEWFIRLSISTVLSLLVGIVVFMVTK